VTAPTPPEPQHHDHTEPIIGCRCAERYPTPERRAEMEREAAAMVAKILPTPPEPQSAPEDVRLSEEERDQILDAILDDRSRAEGYSVLGPGGTDGQTPTVYEAVGRILAARLATAEQKWREAGARDALAEVERRIAASGCDCTELCSMGPTCPGGMLAGLPGSGCWRADAPIHDGNHAPLPEGVWLDPGYCEHCDRKRANYRSERGL
jgi:hypothetical protein